MVPKSYSVLNLVTIGVFSLISIFFVKQNGTLAYGTLVETEVLANSDELQVFGNESIPSSTAFANIIIPKRSRTKPIIYKVQSGDTLSKIASEFEIKITSLIYSNPGKINSANTILRVGQELVIPHVDGITYMIQKGDTYEKLAKKYRGDLQRTKDVNSEIPFEVGQTITIPDGRPPEVVKAPVLKNSPSSGGQVIEIGSANTADLSSGNWYWPMSGKLTQYFGRTNFNPNHTGIDIATKSGTQIRAAKSGKVTNAGWKTGYGNLVIIDHGGGYVTYYAHLSAFKVSVGDKVEKGDVIGLEGSTGRSTGPHLHFEIRYNGKPTNPLNYSYDNK
ncbi:MAG: hypothetical protein Fur0024_5450 [Patescibacteria group bacterium]